VSWRLQLIFGALLLVLLVLQYRLWVGEGSLAEVMQLKRQMAMQSAELADLRERNATLQAEVDDLREGLEAIEARARTELGLIRPGETYFQLLPATEDSRE
jgi:cell division protein FtsB